MWKCQIWHYQWVNLVFEHLQLSLIRGGEINSKSIKTFCIGALLSVHEIILFKSQNVLKRFLIDVLKRFYWRVLKQANPCFQYLYCCFGLSSWWNGHDKNGHMSIIFWFKGIPFNQKLVPCAEDLLTLCPSSAGSERIFSTMGWIHDDLRNWNCGKT